jgi:muramoyltetrapeptide carboxypeptidase
MTRYSIPPPLGMGDKAVIVSPSGHVDSLYINGAASVLKSWGLQVDVSPHAGGCNGRFSGTVEERLSDMQQALDDESIRLIFCSRGGYGAVHLLENLNFEKLLASPKWLVGYSDITALHQLFLHYGVASLHTPMAKHLSENSDDYSSLYLKSALFGERLHYIVEGHPLNIDGAVTGTLFGGNMVVFCSLLATKYATVPSDSILFIEDIGEQAYQIDRMMWTLELSGILERIKGLIIGVFANCDEDPLMYHPIYESIRGIVEKYNIPVSFEFPVGHTNYNYPLLHGGKVNLTVTSRQVECIFNANY